MYLKAIEQLKEGKTIQIRPRGNSMRGKIKSGSLVTIEPLKENPKPKDIVLCKVKGNYYVHLVKCISGKRFQIGNNHGRINGWISINAIFGKVTKVE
jgi:hypothetical protein